jgi:hypothetical protein
LLLGKALAFAWFLVPVRVWGLWQVRRRLSPH